MKFTCPRCGATSTHPDDYRNGYCGRCHDWTGDPMPMDDDGKPTIRRVGSIKMRAGLDPAGRPCVVVQYPGQWLTVRPSDARAWAAALIESADEAEAER